MAKNRIKEKNVLFMTLDSCRYDTAKKANIPNISSIGTLRKAYTHGSYTVPAHMAFFSGHLPIVLDEPLEKYYSESKSQLWRIKTGRSYDNRVSDILLKENNILEAYRKLGYKILGTGGITQFSEGSLLRSYFDEDFLFYGQNLDEEPLKQRKSSQFPLNHIDEILSKLLNQEKWFLFINCPETHYPYDSGEGILPQVEKYFPHLREHLNLRESDSEIQNSQDLSNKLMSMQRQALESIDYGLGELFKQLPKQKDILIVICGDHGENFGEYFAGKQRWGHLFPSDKVMQVPLVIGDIYGNN